MTNAVPILSLVVAGLAVFVGPLVSWLLAQRQQALSMEIANKQIVAPMRQAWINNLRNLLAELTSSALHYYIAGSEGRTEEEYRRLTLLEHKIIMMLNFLEDDHKKLEEFVRRMISTLEAGKGSENSFPQHHAEVMKLSRQIFKREWNVVKDKIMRSY